MMIVAMVVVMLAIIKMPHFGSKLTNIEVSKYGQMKIIKNMIQSESIDVKSFI